MHNCITTRIQIKYLNMGKSFKALSAALCAAMLFSCGGKEDGGGTGPGTSTGKDPTTFVLSGGQGSYTAESQTLNITVLCDVKWTASLSNTTWGKINSQTTNADQTGTINITIGLNGAEESRTNVLTVSAGKQTRTFNIVQRGITSIISQTTVNLAGVEPAHLDLTTKNAWTASIADGATWYTIDPKSGSAGSSRITITPVDANVNVGSRTSSLKITIGSENFTVPVVQAQKNTIIVDVESAWTDYNEALVDINTQTNVDFSVRIQETPWLSVQEVKSLNNKKVTLHVEANPNSVGREAYVYFETDEISEPVLIRQGAYNAIIEQTTPGAFALAGESYSYEPGKKQFSVLRGATTDSYRFLNPAEAKVVEITGVPKEPALGDSFMGGISVMDKISLVHSANYTMYVIKVTDDAVWLSALDDLGIILKK